MTDNHNKIKKEKKKNSHRFTLVPPPNFQKIKTIPRYLENDHLVDGLCFQEELLFIYLTFWHHWYVRWDTSVLMLMSLDGGDSEILEWGRGPQLRWWFPPSEEEGDYFIENWLWLWAWGCTMEDWDLSGHSGLELKWNDGERALI